MSDDYYDYDPGTPYEPPPRRRRRPDYKRESEYDDAWAAADEAGDDIDDVSSEGLAAGYHWQDSDRYGVEREDIGPRTYDGDLPDRPTAPPASDAPRRTPDNAPADLGPLPNSVEQVRNRRPRDPRHIHVRRDERPRGNPPRENRPLPPDRDPRRPNPRQQDPRNQPARSYDPRARDPRDRRPPDPRPPHERRRAPRQPTYHRDRARRGEYGEYFGPRAMPPNAQQAAPAQKPKGKPKRGYADNQPGGLYGIPYWQILIVVVFSVLALLSAAFACVSVLTI